MTYPDKIYIGKLSDGTLGLCNDEYAVEYVRVQPDHIPDGGEMVQQPVTDTNKAALEALDDRFEKTPVGALNTMAAITAQILVNRGLTEAQAANVVNEILDITVDVITGKREAIIMENKNEYN
jgi:hypothetical protein